MAITLYDLAGAEAERRFSPFCWRAKMALARKGLDVATVPWRFTEKDKLPQPNAGRVPVIVDDGQVVHDSTTIAGYLESRYSDRPSLFGGEDGRALTRFIQNWTETVLQPALIGFVVLDICRHSAPQDQAYFRQSREERFGTTLEEVAIPPPMPITSSSAPSSGRGRSAISSCSPATTRLPLGAGGYSTRLAALPANPPPMAADPR
jgi:hypothetical protein